MRLNVPYLVMRDVKAATVGEIMPTVEFYDFDAKVQRQLNRTSNSCRSA